jgi:hypothetical protein
MAKANKAAKKSAAAKAAPVPSPQVAAEELKDQRVKQAAADEKAVKRSDEQMGMARMFTEPKNNYWMAVRGSG